MNGGGADARSTDARGMDADTSAVRGGVACAPENATMDLQKDE